MRIYEAFRIFGLNEKSSIEDLNKSFRKLAKKYHPDFNRGNEKWANSRMTEINLAYEVALNYFTSPDNRSSEKVKRNNLWTFNKYYNRAKNYILQGMLIYYQYGLENVHLRKEGIRKIRFGDSVRYIEKGIKFLKELSFSVTNPEQKEMCEVLLDFTTAFFRNMGNDRYFQPTGNRYEDKAYWHFHNGAVLLDEAIKEILFGDLIVNIPNRGNYLAKLSKSYEEFTLVVTEYPKSTWVIDTVLKIYMVELLTKLLKIFKYMRY